MILTVTLNSAVDVGLLVEGLRIDDRNPVLKQWRNPGGKGLNVSRVVRELGGRTLAIATAGGRTGAELRERVAAAEISVRFVPILGETRTNLEINPRGENRSLRFNFPGPRISDRELRAVFQTVRRSLPKSSFFVLSGSLPPGVPSDVYGRLIRVARTLHVPCALDADGAAMRHGLAARPYFIKPNRFEAERLLGRTLHGERDLLRAARDLLKEGVQIVLLSLGKNGAILASDNVCLRASSPLVRVQSAVGAGDSALAAFLVYWLKTRSLKEALQWAMAAGAACAMTPATELCHRHDVERLVKHVRIRRAIVF